MDPQTASPQSPLPPQSPRFPFLPIVLSLLVLLLSASTAFLAYQNWQLREQLYAPTDISGMPPIPNTITPTDPTADWKMYTSEKASYSFKYPDSWPLVQIPVNSGCGTCIEEIQFTSLYTPQSVDSDLAVILIFKESRIKTLDDYKNIIVKGDSSIVNVRDVVIGGEKAISYRLSGGIPPLPVIEHVVVKNNFYYVIRLVDSKETNKNITANQITFDQILSTFKFTDTTKVQFTMDEISQACIDIRHSTKYWDTKYQECNGAGDDQTPLINFCTKYGGKFVANGDTCRHAQTEGLPSCGPEAAYYCSFK